MKNKIRRNVLKGIIMGISTLILLFTFIVYVLFWGLKPVRNSTNTSDYIKYVNNDVYFPTGFPTSNFELKNASIISFEYKEHYGLNHSTQTSLLCKFNDEGYQAMLLEFNSLTHCITERGRSYRADTDNFYHIDFNYPAPLISKEEGSIVYVLLLDNNEILYVYLASDDNFTRNDVLLNLNSEYLPTQNLKDLCQ